MYKFSYAEIVEESGDESRARERQALDHAIELMTLAEARGVHSLEAQNAIDYVQKLWGFFIKDLTDAANQLPEQLRADLVSIGLWILRESDAILNDQVTSFAGLIEINRVIRDGLQ